MISGNLFTTANIAPWQRALSAVDTGLLDTVRAGIGENFDLQVQLEFAQLIGLPAVLVTNKEFKTTQPNEELPIVICRDNGQFKGLTEEHVEAVIQTLKDRQFNRPKRVRASAITACARQTWFDIMGFEGDSVEEGHPEWGLMALIGTAIHAVLERVMDDSPLATRQEFNIQVPGIFGGKVDLEVELDGEKVLLDWKTVGHKDFIQKEKLVKFYKYFGQLSSYAAVENFNRAIVVLIDRDTLQMQEYELVLDDAYGEELLEGARDIMRHVEQRQVPHAKYLGTRNCNFCQFLRLCDAEELSGAVQDHLDRGLNPSRL